MRGKTRQEKTNIFDDAVQPQPGQKPVELEGLLTDALWIRVANQLTSFTMPADATNLTTLLLFFNRQLTNVSLVAGMRKLDTIDLSGNQLRSFELPCGLTTLVSLNLRDNQLTSLTLPPDMQQLDGLFVDGNPLGLSVLTESIRLERYRPRRRC